GVQHLVRADAAADRKHERRPASRADDHVRDVPGAVEEVPLLERALFALDDQEALAAQDEKVLLVGLAVVHAHRLPRLQRVQVEAELVEFYVVLEVAESPELVLPPARVARVEDEPLRHARILESRACSRPSASSSRSSS